MQFVKRLMNGNDESDIVDLIFDILNAVSNKLNCIARKNEGPANSRIIFDAANKNEDQDIQFLLISVDFLILKFEVVESCDPHFGGFTAMSR